MLFSFFSYTCPEFFHEKDFTPHISNESPMEVINYINSLVVPAYKKVIKYKD